MRVVPYKWNLYIIQHEQLSNGAIRVRNIVYIDNTIFLINNKIRSIKYYGNVTYIEKKSPTY